jgi:hypothetical protein
MLVSTMLQGPASTRALTICRGVVLPLGCATRQITAYPRGYTRGLHQPGLGVQKAFDVLDVVEILLFRADFVGIA